MGASPDAIVSCECHGTGTVEIKCPYSHRYSSINKALEDKQFCLVKLVDGKLALSTQHPYYSQVQAQIFLTGLLYCDFVVWTTVEMCCVRVFPDQSFWDSCVERASKFFHLAVLPELVGHVSEKSDILLSSEASPSSSGRKRQLSLSPQKPNTCTSKTSTAVYCFCRKPENGLMIGCDGENCRYEWCRYECLSLEDAPDGDWFCPQCKTQM